MLIDFFDKRTVVFPEAVVVVFDLECFSRCYQRTDVHLHFPSYFNVVLESLHQIFHPQKPYWFPDTVNWVPVEREPNFAKYTGDGGIYIWTEQPLDAEFQFYLINALWTFKRVFPQIVNLARDSAPLHYLPERIRFGITRGSVFGLTRESGPPIDYNGNAINLAARLQGYCPDIGLVASASVDLPESKLSRFGFVKKRAVEIKGFDSEYVFVDRDDYDQLGQDSQSRFFA